LSSQSFQEVLLYGFFGAHDWLHLKFLELHEQLSEREMHEFEVLQFI
jgi:hypothetical protein